MRDKMAFTESLVKLLPEESRINVYQAYSTWWINLRNQGGLRLTDVGYTVFCQVLEFKQYEYDFSQYDSNFAQYDKKMLLQLDQTLENPYYITGKKIQSKLIFFSSKEAMLAKLYGNLDKFLMNYK